MKQDSKNTINRNFIIGVLLISIILLVGVTYFQFQNFKKITKSFHLPEFEIKMPELKLFPQEKEITKEEFISEDGKLKFSYPSSWIRVEALTEDTDFLAMLNEQLVKEGVKILFLAQKIDIKESSSAFMVVEKTELGEKKTLEEIIQSSAEEIKDSEMLSEIMSTEKIGNEAQLEINYKKAGDTLYHSIKKIILAEDAVYTIEIYSLKDIWQKVAEEAQQILDSAKIIPIPE